VGVASRTRERAAMLCQIAASNVEQVREDHGSDMDQLALHLFGEHDSDAVELAASAWLAVDPEPLGITDPWDGTREAEAEAMLRCGWAPADGPRWRPGDHDPEDES
jgi:hypothetical protein